ncbi:MAG TPA: hypothetical protein VI522_03255 [Gammaproteobacteria bacterium]|nr:hypothetical protein [Gammaproteobacteria bacterium]
MKSSRQLGIKPVAMKNTEKKPAQAIFDRIIEDLALSRVQSEFSRAFADIINQAVERKLTTIELIEANIPSYQRNKNNFYNEYKSRFAVDVEIREIQTMLNDWLIDQVKQKLTQTTDVDAMDVDGCADLLANTLKLKNDVVLKAPDWRKSKNRGLTTPKSESNNNCDDVMSPASSSKSSPIVTSVALTTTTTTPTGEFSFF